VRLAAIQAAILAIAFGAAVFGAHWITRHDLRSVLRDRVRAEMTILLDERAVEGRKAFEEEVARVRRKSGLLLRYVDTDGRIIVDDFGNAPSFGSGWASLDWDRPGATHPIITDIDILTVRLPSGERLSIGATRLAEERIRARLVASLYATGLIAALAALLASIVAGYATFARVDDLAAVTRSAANGRLDRRVRAAKTGGDDIDLIGRSVNRMLDDLEILVGELRSTGAAIAHDVRTPLARLANNLARAEATTDDVARSTALAAARTDLTEALALVTSTLRLAEIEGELEAANVPLDLADVAARICDAYRPEVEDSGRRLTTDLAPASARADEAQIGQALANLLENAIAHTPPGAHIRVSTVLQNGRAMLQVCDDGPGIAVADRARVVRHFTRASGGRDRDGGVGLGLAIVAAIVRRHGADLRLSDAAPGLIVQINFPPPNAHAI
jgi:signal transduction histidine kinase